MSSNDYWRKREEEALAGYQKSEAEYDKEINRIYSDMLDACNKEINAFYGKYAKAEGITLAEAKKRVSKLDIEEYERKAAKYVKDASLDRKVNGGKTNKQGYYFSEKANEEMRLYNATMKINRLEMLKANIGLEMIKGHAELETFMSDILQGRTAEELARQAGILGKTVRNNAQLAHAIPNASFHNATFSDRVWMYHDIMKADLSKLIEQGLIRGKNPRQLARELEKYVKGDAKGGAKFNAERLMRTELARVQTEAQKQSFERNGFEEYEFIANSNCCDICKSKDGKHFKVADMMPGENAAPMHPHCRCSTAAYSDRAEYEEWLDYLANGGTTAEWEKLKAATPIPTATEKPLDISSMSKEEFEQWKKAYYDDVNGNVHLTAAELKALDDYGEGGYELLNAYGRYGADSDKFKAVLTKYGNRYTTAEVEEKFNAVQSALNKFSLNESIIVHRAVRDISFMTDDISVEGLKKLKGKIITEGGFVSTSLAYQSKFEGKNPNAVHIEYVLPKGTKGAYIDKFVAKDEHEFLLSAGTKYKIVDGGERVVKVPKYDFKQRKWVEIEKTERFLKAEVIPGVLTKTVKSSTIPPEKFIPAKDMKEAKTRFSKALSIPEEKINLGRMKPDLANQYLEGVEKFTADFPMLKKYYGTLGTKMGNSSTLGLNKLTGTYVEQNGVRHIKYSAELHLKNPQDVSKMMNVYERISKTGEGYANSTPKSTAIHELVHGIDKAITMKKQGAFNESGLNGLVYSANHGLAISGVSRKIIKQVREEMFGTQYGKEVAEATRYLGSYARTSPTEELAEAISYEYVNPSNPYSARILELFKKEVEGAFGQ